MLILCRQTHVQTSIFALTRSPRFYHDPLYYRPQRWLRSSHPLYDAAFAADELKGFHPFSLGPRSCIGREMAWMQGKLFVAKVLWTFDVVKLPGQQFDLEGTLLHYGFLAKPEPAMAGRRCRDRQKPMPPLTRKGDRRRSCCKAG